MLWFSKHQGGIVLLLQRILHSLLKRWNCIPRRPIALQKVYEAELFFLGHSLRIYSQHVKHNMAKLPRSIYGYVRLFCICFKMWCTCFFRSLQWVIRRHFSGESLPAAGHWIGRPLFASGTVSVCEACWHQAPQTNGSSTPDVCEAQQGSTGGG